MPRPAQERGSRSPVAALLILLGLLLGSGGTISGFEARDGSARLGSDRHGAPASLLRTAQRAPSPDDDEGSGPGAAGPARAADVVTVALASRPGTAAAAAPAFALAEAAPASYRARAPPAA